MLICASCAAVKADDVAMKAILLAAGEGSRLRPLTTNKPKPMIRAANKPIAQYGVEALVAAGIREQTIVVGYRRTKVQSYFGDGVKFGAKISYAFQEALLGTAHAVAMAPRPGTPFVVLGADNVIEPAVIKQLLSAGVDKPTIVIRRSDKPSRYGVVKAAEGRLVSIEEHPDTPASEWINTGVYLFPDAYHAKIVALVEEGHLGIPDVLNALVAKGDQIRVVRTDALWCDAVYPWDLLDVHARLLSGARAPELGPRVVGESPLLVGESSSIGPNTVLGAGTSIGSNVTIHAGCILENCIVYDDVQIGPGSILQDTIIGEGTRIGPRFTAVSGACDIPTPDGWHHLEDFGAILGEDVVVGGNVTLLPGAVLGNKVVVDHGKTVGKFVSDHGKVL